MGDSVTEVVTAIVNVRENVSHETIKERLQSAQEVLVRRVCKSCWPSGEREILWVHSYVELAKVLVQDLESIPGYVSADWFLHRAAGIALPSNNPIDFYVNTLIPLLNDEALIPKNERQEKWLSDMLAKSTAPPIFRLWHQQDSLAWDPPIGDVHDLYKCLFRDGREAGLYLHIGDPGRGAMSQIGAAGVYLFLRRREAYNELPRCLVFHLRAFVQTLVTAQILRAVYQIREHESRRAQQIEEALGAAKVIIRNGGILQDIANSVEPLRKALDPLGIDIGAFDAAQRCAHRMFTMSDTHHVSNWLSKNKAVARAALETLCESLDEVLEQHTDESACVISAVKDAIRLAVDRNDLEAALRHAKALDHHSVMLSLLCSGADNDRTVSEQYQRSDRDKHPLKETVTRLFLNKDKIHPRQIRDDTFAIELELQHETFFNIGALVDSARNLVDGKWGSGECETSKPVAQIARGLLGAPLNSENRPDQSLENQWWEAAKGVENRVCFTFQARRED